MTDKNSLKSTTILLSQPTNNVSAHAQRSPCECYAHYLANCGRQVSNQEFVDGLCPECAQMVTELFTQVEELSKRHKKAQGAPNL